MGVSHQAIINAHPDVELSAICDKSDYILEIINKYTGCRIYTDYKEVLDKEKLDAVVIATPPKFHAEIVRSCLERNLHVFCEKPFCLDPADSISLANLAEKKNLVNQVGYHYRFVATFQEMKRLIDLGILGKLHHIRAEAYGPVVLRPKGGLWRSSKAEGGGCLYDYASHAIDLMNYLVGRPKKVGSSVLNSLFSSDVEDEVYSTFFYADGLTGQLNANWSDESHRKMSTKLTVWGENGRIISDRQEIQVYLRDATKVPAGFTRGWNVRYITDIAQPVWYYLRGEEYSLQMDDFFKAILEKRPSQSPFHSAADADIIAAAISRAVYIPAVDVATQQIGVTTPARPAAATGFIGDLKARLLR